ncbi:MAG TPA: hypothetical protein ENJ19_07685 [Gammaproteobacteria bacterium]|nr:hypothetical protein [Gammaproteobacteria bacterium]
MNSVADADIDRAGYAIYHPVPMKRLLALLLLLANLSAAAAYAWDSHPEAWAGHGPAAVTGMLDGHHLPLPAGTHHGDHCCHGAAHLTGIIAHDTALPVGLCPRLAMSSERCLLPSYVAPLLRPPIV